MKSYQIDPEIIMKAIIFAAAASLVLTAGFASAAPRKQAQTEKSPQVTAHEQTTSKQDNGGDFWSKKATYKPHWRNHYTN
jgi:hypothetical protein